VSVSRTRREAEHALPAVTPIVTTRKLTVPPPKTGIVDVTRAGVELRGFHFHQGRARQSGQLIPRMWPGQTAMQARRRHIREQTERRGLRDTMAAMVANLNPIMRGWRTYCRVGNSTKQFQALDRDGRHRVVQWIQARVKRGAPPDQLQALYRTSGLESCSARGRCGTRP
jgi:hypothetical protein